MEAVIENTMRFINLDYLRRRISGSEFNNLNLKYLPLLQQEIALILQNVDTSKSKFK